MRRTIWIVVFLLAAGVPVFAESHDEIAKEVIALTKAQWAADIAKDTAKSVELLADEYTEFNSQYPTRLDGKKLNATFYEAANAGAGEILVAEMANEKVQVYGDVAILSYNYVGSTKNKDGEIEPNLAKSTRVYAKKDGAWKLVHANFAPLD
jgi:ketosteroid isomerase-like protein